jgi:glutathione S-transferase
MLTFYYHPLSPIARRVWVALLEKGISFQPVIIKLQNKEQLQPDFLALNPFHHVPVLVDEEVCLIESIAILDYLELQYPTPALMPQSPAAIARIKMLQMVNINELSPKIMEFLNAEQTPVPDSTFEHIDTALAFFTQQLGEGPFFSGESFGLADIVLGITLSMLYRLGLSLKGYPAIANWQSRISARQSWCLTQPSDEDFAQWKRFVRLQVQQRNQDLRKQLATH